MTTFGVLAVLLHMPWPRYSPPNIKALRSIASGPLCVYVSAGYFAAVTTKAALAALAALFFSRLTLAQRFC